MSKERRLSSLSVIIPAYNAEKFINISIESILRQNVNIDEIIVVDDGSQDNTVSYIRDNYPMVKLIQQENGGPSKARNTGVKNATSEFISFLDADDEWCINAVYIWKEVIEKNNEFNFFVGNYSVKNWINIVSRSDESRAIDSPIISFANGNLKIWTGAVCIKKNSFNNVGGFDENLRNGEDIDLWLRLLLAEKKIYCTTEVIAKYNFINDNSITSTFHRVDFRSREKLTFKYLEGNVILDSEERKYINIYFSNFYNSEFLSSLFIFDIKRAIKILSLKRKFKLNKPTIASVYRLLRFQILKKK
ncbi:glycosyltransferase family A protein [Elizabethkingia anophelis]|uniref:glycosyltransferase family A protein n=1 Tax=Elizabethkingia anophelis TaxID=1117645 RepID=UPI000999A494|nr:glycosyltransferase family A protein [Elizabethkingia anophelis]MCT4287931.1 glycosyltransferase family 2 protein [Elizabethkingia anophelis]MCT4315777.1 glycosyltransferase family 2 protein [Elizabethkingia anophelis]MDV3880394.1 glycosyltransferase family 2 protein [Elizabethkingia anophelis]OPC31763.1 hypothetical protein BAX98_06895 [Elizabethkingia anophelis]